MRFEALIQEQLQQLARAGLLREPDDGAGRAEVNASAARLGRPVLDASSNDYLDLAEHSVSRETPARAGAGASRLIHGTTTEHLQLEAALASWVRAESALLFSSTYSANLGLLAAVGMQGTSILSDAANHASIVDGARLAKAEVEIIPHLDLDAMRSALRSRRAASACWVVTESYFSMDGDGPDLPSLRSLCDEYDACLIVDEAHALGVFGPTGGGRCAEAGVVPHVLVGALGKAVGTHGGFVASSKALRGFLWNRARSFVFSTAPSPRHAALTREHLETVRHSDALREKLSLQGERLRVLLRSAGLKIVPGSFGPIVSVVVGDNQAAVEAAARLRGVGILSQAIRPPTVPSGSARLRLTIRAAFRDEDIERLAMAVEVACRAS